MPAVGGGGRGLLLRGKGPEVTQQLVERLKNWGARGEVDEPLYVTEPLRPTEPPRPSA